ncbi:hypothetical protein V6N13_050967 [Hibiscus sabdariffa]|uniref:Uncharacterized protein n=1 Tax=Hibiscus sabdariffa TaxID=183260 RepID=A0ABR2T2T6_9ROSI
MDDRGCGKVTGIRHIVRLKEIIQKWQTATLGSRPSAPRSGGDCPGSVSRPINKRLKNVMYCDSDEESCASPEPPPDVPKGYLAVYVGPELRRFIIPTSYLTHPVFKILLEKAEEEFGYDHNGGLTLPCEIETFKYLLQCIENHPKGYLVESSVSKQVRCSCRFYAEFVYPWVSLTMEILLQLEIH